MTISLRQANDLISAIFSAGQDLHLKPLSVVVTDPGGHVIAFQRQDGASAGRFQIALGKAGGAIFLGVSSRTIGEIAVDRPTFVASLGGLCSEGIVPAAGGLLVTAGDSAIVGAVGVTGDTSDNDEQAAKLGLRAVGLHSRD
jgi:uncharacterized protein GlcG (DUF336 family)